MTTAAIKQKLHQYLEVADGKKLRAIYNIIEDQIEDATAGFTDEFKAELDRRTLEYKQGTAVVFTAEESEERIKNIVKAYGK